MIENNFNLGEEESDEENEKYDGTKCTICGKLFKWVGMSPVEGVCTKCFLGEEYE